MTDHEGRYITYNCGDNFGNALFVPQCPHCGRFVKADDKLDMEVTLGDQYRFGPNATCAKCGRVLMPFEGWF